MKKGFGEQKCLSKPSFGADIAKVDEFDGMLFRRHWLTEADCSTIVLDIYDKIQSLLGSEKLFDEVEVARKLIKSYMPERHAMAIAFI